MKKVKSIHASLIGAVLLASVSTSANAWFEDDPVHWAPFNNALEYFFGCTIAQYCVGSKWR